MTKSTKCPHCSAPIHLPAGDEWTPIKCNFCGLAVKISDFAGSAKPNEPAFEPIEKIDQVDQVDDKEPASAVEQVRSDPPTSEPVSTPAVSNEPVAEPESVARAEPVEPEQAATTASPDVVAAAAAPQEAIPEPVPPVVDRSVPPVVDRSVPPVVDRPVPPVVDRSVPPVVDRSVPPVVDRRAPPVEPKESRRGRVTNAASVSTTAPVVAQGDVAGADFTPDAYGAADNDAPSVWNTVVMVACIALVILSVVLAVVLVYNS
jgi:hypothetical protein